MAIDEKPALAGGAACAGDLTLALAPDGDNIALLHGSVAFEALLIVEEHRACGDLALHVLEIMEAIHVSSDKLCQVKLESTCTRPEPMKL